MCVCLLTDRLHDDCPEAAVPLPPVYPHVAILPPAGAPGVLQLPVVHTIAEMHCQLEIVFISILYCSTTQYLQGAPILLFTYTLTFPVIHC